ncbi:hypothetical protein F5B22DRAFT_649209 [Xylaria bambusicola]|uniref:uncharacterized protein n=1 Tax=Xylaria bambusicola TaxID=326684 RepID=UPI0020083784|nr:uncharacterized protein F5B22DRAFT_649209 [Xylaria bambusicola]KAI0509161.1 hypothetical protein F5B22DRAFT_649209 [Xylaria bambusicola]
MDGSGEAEVRQRVPTYSGIITGDIHGGLHSVNTGVFNYSSFSYGETPFERTNLFKSHSMTDAQKVTFLNTVWPNSLGNRTAARSFGDLDFYFDYVSQQCSSAKAEAHAIKTFLDLFVIIRILQSQPLLNFERIVAQIIKERPRLAKQLPEKIYHSIEFALRLCLLLNIQIGNSSAIFQLPRPIQWPEEMDFSSALATFVTTHQCDIDAEFSGFFNFYDMERIGGITVEWTLDLTSHLSMKGSVIYVFHGVSILKRMHESAETSGALLNQRFIEETLATINLLIPNNNASCNDWLNNEIKRSKLDKDIINRDTPTMGKGRYPYWQDRLVVIEKFFDSTKPRNLLQWWRDTRDMQRWWAFWIPLTGFIMALLFGLFQGTIALMQFLKPKSRSG